MAFVLRHSIAEVPGSGSKVGTIGSMGGAGAGRAIMVAILAPAVVVRTTSTVHMGTLGRTFISKCGRTTKPPLSLSPPSRARAAAHCTSLLDWHDMHFHPRFTPRGAALGAAGDYAQ